MDSPGANAGMRSRRFAARRNCSHSRVDTPADRSRVFDHAGDLGARWETDRPSSSVRRHASRAMVRLRKAAVRASPDLDPQRAGRARIEPSDVSSPRTTVKRRRTEDEATVGVIKPSRAAGGSHLTTTAVLGTERANAFAPRCTTLPYCECRLALLLRYSHVPPSGQHD